MRRIVLVVLIVAAVFHIDATPLASSAEPITIWHIPHPDDETLGMAGGIHQAALEGRRNIVVFYTGGEASGVRASVNALRDAWTHEDAEAAEWLAYLPLKGSAFPNARMTETRAALQVLGVTDDDIIEVALRDGAITHRDALSVMRQLHEQYPEAAHRTTSIYDKHSDHRALARALLALEREVQAAGVEMDIGFYRVYIYYTAQAKRAELHRVRAMPVPDPELKRKALAEFAVWDPSNGRFAIGMQSVPHLFQEAALDPYEYMDIITDQAPPGILRGGDVELALFNDGITVAYRIHPQWRGRIDNSLSTVAPAFAVMRSTLPMAYGVRLYTGVGFAPAGGSFRPYWMTGIDMMQRVMLEYSTNPQVGSWRMGYHFIY